jgi:hypothetical protein
MIKKIAKALLPNVIQNKIRYKIMVKHKKDTLTRELNNKKYQYKKDLLIIKKYEAIYKSANLNFNKNQQKLIYNLSKSGLFIGDFRSYYSKSDYVLEYLRELAKPIKGKTLEEAEKMNLQYEESYNKHSKGHLVNLYHPKKNIQDPIKELFTDPAIFTMAARYLGEIPKVMMMQFLFTPANTLNPKGPMLWHLDRHHDSVFRVFINPFEMTKENGATKAFPSKYNEDDYYQSYPYFNNKQAEENGFDMNDVVHIVGKPGRFGVVDTCKNFHCGSVSKKERFVAIMTFVPHMFKGEYDEPNLVGDKYLFEKENKIIYNYFKNKANIEV